MTKQVSLPAIADLFRPIASDTKPRAILLSLSEVILWGILGLAVAFTMLALRPDPLLNDSFQYLNIAANVRHGNGIATDLVLYDTERSHGRIPAPMTTLAPGYSIAVAALSGFVGGFESAARILSAICFAGTSALLAYFLIVVRVDPFIRIAMLLLFVTNATIVSFSTAVMACSMFVFLCTASIVVLTRAWGEFQRPRVQLPPLIAGFILAGLSYWVRYAGLFLIAALLVYLVARTIWHRRRIAAAELWAVLIPLVVAGSLTFRNVFMVGTWKGGNEMSVSNPLRRVMADFVLAQYHLLLGMHEARFGLWEALLLAGCLSLIALLGSTLLLRDSGADRPSAAFGPWTLLITCLAVYSAGLCYAGLRTVISFGTRMFLPALPLYLLLLGLVLHWLIQRARFSGGQIWFRTALCVLVIGYIGVNVRDLKTPQEKSRQVYLSGLFSERTDDGQKLSDWVNTHTSPDTAIAAQDGQATGYLLQRRTLALVESEYSAERWECPEIRNQMNRFGALYLILYPHPDHSSRLLNESRFAAQAASGKPPCGFVIASQNQDVRILQIEPLAVAGNSLPK